jgi:hypothetical protein
MHTIWEDPEAHVIMAAAESPLSKADAKSITTRSRALCASGAVSVYKGDERVGSMVGIGIWPYKYRCTVTDGTGVMKSDLIFPTGTCYVQMELTPKAFAAHKAGQLELDDCRASGGGEGRKRVSIANLVGTRKFAYSDGVHERTGSYRPDPYHGTGDPPQSLVSPDDGAELSPYGLADINSIPLAAQAQALDNSYHALGASGFHEHLRQHHPTVLHALAAHDAIKRRPALHGAILAALADPAHPTPTDEREVDSYSPAVREAHELAHHAEHQGSNQGLQSAYVGDEAGRAQPTSTFAGDLSTEGINLGSVKGGSLYQRYGAGFERMPAHVAQGIAVHPQASPRVRRLAARRARR